MWQVVLEVPRGGQAGTPGWLWLWLLSQGQPQCLTGKGRARPFPPGFP